MHEQNILINYTPQETRVAVVEAGCVQELHLERSLERGLLGNIYLGKVTRVLPGMQSAFIDIGLDKAAFLHVSDVWTTERYQELEKHYQTAGSKNSARGVKELDSRSTNALANNKPIEKQIFEGQSLLVQVVKDPISGKGARLTTQISIVGRLLVFLPQDNHIGVSQRIEAQLREELRQRLLTLARDTDSATNKAARGGFILRTNAEHATDLELQEDITYLRKVWQKIKQQITQLPVKSLIHAELDLARRLLRDWVTSDTGMIQLDSAELLQQLSEFAQEYTPAVLPKLKLHQTKHPIFDQYRIDEEVNLSLDKRVNLKSGGYLIIEQTEALTTIDVNTGGFTGRKTFAETILKTNLEAAQAIVRQLRLRNLGGIVVIDFIDMSSSAHQQMVLAELRRQLSFDRVKTTSSEFSALGLVELTRKRTRESLIQALCEDCAVCGGKGVVKTLRSVAYDILREIEREALQFNPNAFRIVAAPEVAEILLDEENLFMNLLSEKIGKPILLQSDSNMLQEDYDIILV